MWVLGGKQGLTGLAPKSLKSASLQKVWQTDALAWRVLQEFKTELSSIGTGILKVCKCPEINNEQWNNYREGPCLCMRVFVSGYMYVYMTVCEFPYF